MFKYFRKFRKKQNVIERISNVNEDFIEKLFDLRISLLKCPPRLSKIEYDEKLKDIERERNIYRRKEKLKRILNES
jgi:aminopeptidase C